MRPKSMLVWSVCILSVSGCSGQGDRTRRAEEAAREALARLPQDSLFVNFEQNWRERISAAPELALPVLERDVPPRIPWEPVVISECVFSADAGGMVPQTTLTWNDPVAEEPGVSVSLAGRRQLQPVQQQQPPPPQPPPQSVTPPSQRVDLAVHFDGFGRNYFSTALSTAALERFSLPSNSSLVTDAAAVMATGPALFPRLIDCRAEMIRDRDTARQLRRQTITLRDLSEGQSYHIRLSSPGRAAWNEDRQYAFLTPSCPKGS
jgi:hypothetical protein